MPSDAKVQRVAAVPLNGQRHAHLDGPDEVEFMGLRLHNLHRDEIATRVIAAAAERRRMLVVNANAHMMVLAQNLAWMRGLFKRADIAFCDGSGVQLAIRLLLGRGVHRTTPPEWIGQVLSALGPEASVFWLGGQENVAIEAARRYEERYRIRTAGVQHGFFDMSPNSAESKALVARINASAPSIILVNMGMPRQERWLWDNFDQLNCGVAITAGALVDHAAGRVRRPPRWVANLGIEWLIRLLHEPRRLWRRYLIGLPVFGFYALRFKLSGSANNLSEDCNP